MIEAGGVGVTIGGGVEEVDVQTVAADVRVVIVEVVIFIPAVTVPGAETGPPRSDDLR